MNFLNPLGFIALLSVPAIILLYILKQKYKTYEVGSMALWEKVLVQSDGHKWRQKLKKNLLMFLQIAVALLLTVALARPFIASIGERENVVLILDSSLSMQAVDETPSRFEKAKEDMKKLVENAQEDTFFTVINFDDTPYALSTLNQDKSTVIRAIDAIKVKETSVDEEGLKGVLAGLEAKDTASIYIFTDKNYDLSIDGITTAIYGKGGQNYAIEYMKENQGHVLVKVSSYGQGKQCKVALFADGVIVDSKEVVFTENNHVDVVFDVTKEEYGYLSAKIIDSADILEADDIFNISGVVNKQKKVLLITQGNIFLEKAVSLIENVDLYKGDISQSENLTGYDLYIFDGVTPETLPKDGHLWMLNPGENPFVELSDKKDITSVYFASNLFKENIDNIGFASDKLRTVKAPLWAETVISSAEGGLVIYGEKDGQNICIFTFDIHDTQLPVLKEFPILVYNIISTFMPQKALSEAELYSGGNAEVSLMPKTVAASLKTPQGEIRQVDIIKGIKEQFYETGVYTLTQSFEDNTREVSYFTVNPVTINESNMERGVSEEGNTENKGIKTGKSLVPLVVLLAFIVLCIEWWVNWRDN